MFDAINPKATLVAINYNFLSSIDFTNKLEEKNILEKYNLTLQEYQVRGQVPPADIINNLRGLLPCVYRSGDMTVQVVYTQNEFKLLVEKIKISEENFAQFKELANDIIDLKLSDISAIGINYTANFDLGKAKLNLLNDAIVNEIPDFSRNVTFEFSLPISYPERGLVAVYKIKKVSGGGDTDNPRIYNVNVNFHFDITNLTTSQKSEKLKEILSYDLYKEFFEKSQGFLKLNNGQTK